MSTNTPAGPAERVRPSRLARRGIGFATVAAAAAACLVGCGGGTGAGGPQAHEPPTLTGGAGAASTATPADGPGGNATRGALIGGAIGLSTGGLDDGSGGPAGGGEAPGRPRQATDSGRGLGGSSRTSPDDVVAWSRQGKTDDVIVDRIERGDTVFHLTAADETTLHTRGVSDDVIRAMKQTERR